ncbi:L-threonine 3-dehydrogenase [Asticcacaulis benevestitus]|uniref:L-threonine 3-dehydrogenase n=2 Tax=Asticcacaulis TaxID=76890 RepID=V4Q1G8_9CAUL|nr:L-threonine 3-dehydrogenase [Asticcacaulis benevestitus]ESQ94491.1 L-threonine 3-dehydrogenase [Asticcacaulis benevestitus DSM 16100 = ATCC BAA-896]
MDDLRPVISAKTLPATMTALAKLKAEPGIWQTTAPVPDCGPDDVLIRITHTAICGTDVHIYNWDQWAQKTIPVPMVVGHEFAGEIVAIGARVSRPLKVGQRVSGEGHVINMDSDAARAGHFHLDPETQGIGVNRPGAFAQYLALPAFNVVPLPERVSNELGAVLDPFGNAVHTVQQTDMVGANVLVTGAGPIGIMAAAVARFIGARSVTLTDINPYRLDLAAKVADIRTVDVSKEDLNDVRHELGIANGYDVCMEMSGAKPAIPQAIEHLRMGGALTLLGIPAGESTVNWNDIIMKALTVRGVYGREMFETWRKMLGLIEAGFPLERIITHRLPASEFQQGFDIMRAGQSGKIVLDWRQA